MNELRLEKGTPLAVEADPDGTVSLVFVLEGGTHLHIQTTRSGLETLSRHTAAALAQMPAAKPHR